MRKYYDRLLATMKGAPVINTHSHFMESSEFKPYDLDALLTHSYVNWREKTPEASPGARKDYLDKVRHNSYILWLERALKDIYRLDGGITEGNWEELSEKIQKAHKDGSASITFLKQTCNYQKIIHDPYWNPQQAIKYPGFFTPTYRVNMFLYGWGPAIHDHNGHNAQVVLGTNIKDIDEYVDMMHRTILQRKADGCVALKSSIAYDRELDFHETSKEAAQKALSAGNDAGAQEIRWFQDYIYYQACKTAAALDLPFQNHTGLGILRKTNAMQLHEAIDKNPDTRFVLFHGSYPWTEDICALLHNYHNVYPDLCWLPIISNTACERLLGELIDVGSSDKVTWGCDTWTSEESYGALLSVRHVLAKVLSKKIEEGFMTLNDAEKLTKKILFENAKQLYSL